MFIWLIKEILIYCHCYSICHPGEKNPRICRQLFWIYIHTERGEQRCAEYKWNSNLLQILNQLQLITDACIEQTMGPASGNAEAGFWLVLTTPQRQQDELCAVVLCLLRIQTRSATCIMGMVRCYDKEFLIAWQLFQEATSNTFIVIFGKGA